MWQVSGRSDITDFEEVVRLDKEWKGFREIGNSVGIVGARRCSQKMKQKCVEIAQSYIQQGIAIVSGMAKGIDTICGHNGLEGIIFRPYKSTLLPCSIKFVGKSEQDIIKMPGCCEYKVVYNENGAGV